jgi:hypothetical protein
MDSSVPLSAYFDVGSPLLGELEQASDRLSRTALMANAIPCRG